MLNVYRDACKVCFGDSIGIYFSEAYFSPAVSKNGRPPLKAAVRQQLRRIKYSLRSRLSVIRRRCETWCSMRSSLTSVTFCCLRF